MHVYTHMYILYVRKSICMLISCYAKDFSGTCKISVSNNTVVGTMELRWEGGSTHPMHPLQKILRYTKIGNFSFQWTSNWIAFAFACCMYKHDHCTCVLVLYRNTPPCLHWNVVQKCITSILNLVVLIFIST